MAKKKKHSTEIVTTETFKEVARNDWNSEVEVCSFIGMLIKMTGAKNVLEIGVFEGETAREMILSLPAGGIYTGIDINDYRLEDVTEKMDGHSFILSQSVAYLNSLKNAEFDFVFVDGDHSWENVLTEFKAIEKVIKKGATIVYHDTIHLDGPRKLVEYATHYKYNAVTLNTPEGRGLSIIH